METIFEDPAEALRPAIRCDICRLPIDAGERFYDDGSEVAHAACVDGWFLLNYGREGLS